jgi:hypothetical protein
MCTQVSLDCFADRCSHYWFLDGGIADFSRYEKISEGNRCVTKSRNDSTPHWQVRKYLFCGSSTGMIFGTYNKSSSVLQGLLYHNLIYSPARFLLLIISAGSRH